MAFYLECITVGPLQENCYLLADNDSKQAVLIDPGEEAQRILEALDSKALNLEAIWLSHAHFDHVGAVAEVVEKHDIPILMHPDDEPMLVHASEIAARWDVPIKQPPTDYHPLADGQILSLGQYDFTCLFTPGHAPGHIAFYQANENLVIAGDALFRGSIGRTDLPMGNHEQLIESIKTKLLTLPEHTIVYPGHGSETTIGFEASSNPFLV